MFILTMVLQNRFVEQLREERAVPFSIEKDQVEVIRIILKRSLD